MGSAQETYRLSIIYKEQRYAVLAHSVEQDESVYVRKRIKNPKPDSPYYNIKISGSAIELGDEIEPIGNQVHYHPSGMVKIKRDNQEIGLPFRLPNFLELKEPIPLLEFSPHDISKLEVDDKSEDLVVDITNWQFQRLSVSVWIGPKGSMTAPPIQDGVLCSCVYPETFYDVLYLFRDLGSLPAQFKALNLNMFPRSSAIITSRSEIPHENWVGAIATARQLRTFMEDFFKRCLLSKVALPCRAPLLLSQTSYHLQMNLCADGVIAAIEPRPDRSQGDSSMTWAVFPSLPVATVLEMLVNNRPFIDVAPFKPNLPGGAMYFRVQSGIGDSMPYEIVVVASSVKKSAGHYELPSVYLQAAAAIHNGIVQAIRKHKGQSGTYF